MLILPMVLENIMCQHLADETFRKSPSEFQNVQMRYNRNKDTIKENAKAFV